MVASQSTTRASGSQELLEERMAPKSSEQADDPLAEEEQMSRDGIDWIEGTLMLSF